MKLRRPKVAEQFSLVPQERLAAIGRNWIAIGLSTEPADRPRAEAGVRLAYRRAGLDDGVRIIWALSPASGAIIAESLTRRDSLPRHPAVGVKPAAQMPREALALMTPATAKIVRAIVEPVATYVSERVWKPIDRQIARLVRRPAVPAAFGQHDAPWIAVADVLGQSGADVSQMEASAEIAQSCGWWWPFEDVCVLSERPSLLVLDQQGHLHSSDGPAVRYPDGWSLYAWHGVVVNANVVHYPNLITVAQIERERHPAIRRVLLERYGIERYSRDTGRTLLRLESGMEISGPAAAAGEAPAIESDWIAAIFRGQRGIYIRGQREPQA